MSSSPSKVAEQLHNSSPSKKAAMLSVKDIKATVPELPLDYSFMGLHSVSDIVTETPVTGEKLDRDNAKQVESQKKRPVSLRLSNNSITSMDGLEDSLKTVYYDPKLLHWIDLSGNAVTDLPIDTFDSCPNLATLHMHGNQLRKFSDIDAIAKLKDLRSLTLHGNPLEEKKHYRNYVIHMIPSLIQLDFSPVTKIDREKATAWSLVYRKKLEERQGSREEVGISDTQS